MELLAPAGSFEALKAAVSAGADAVYFGGTVLNARMFSKNFTNEELAEAAAYCRSFGRKAYLTLNTLISDKELKEIVPFIERVNQTAIDAVIVQDLGLARLIRQIAPELPIHASTQMTIHNLDGVRTAAELGFSRVVVSRELPQSQLKYICEHAPVEIEAFIHGALCMCYSGQCYMSSVIGERSGNRGKCAQPCRKMYENGYELSLKDLCMAQDFVSFLNCGVHSLKIEGRMKSPEYVAGVVQIYRKLIDEKRNATSEELKALEALFSREGFTNGYFKDKPGSSMFGVRTEADKKKSREINLEYAEPKIKVSVRFCALKDRDMQLEMTAGNMDAVIKAPPAFTAEKVGTTAEQCQKQLGKLGGTRFEAKTIDCLVDEGLFIPVGLLNQMRRDCVAELEQKCVRTVDRPFLKAQEHIEEQIQQELRIASCQTVEQARAVSEIVDEIWLPLFAIKENVGGKTCVVLPPVLFDREQPAVEERLQEVLEMGITKVVCRNIGQIALCKKLGLEIHGDSGLNLFNSDSIQAASELGLKSAVLSFEANAAQIRDMKKCIQTNTMVYGRYPVMVTENCILKNRNGCIQHTGFGALKDGTGRAFPVFCAFPHRNVFYNAVPLYLGDKKNELPDGGQVFAFTTESGAQAKQILNMYEKGAPFTGDFTRGFHKKKV